MDKQLKIALIQMSPSADRDLNLTKAAAGIEHARQAGAEWIMLPEFFNSPYDMKQVNRYAEPAEGESWRFLAEQARRHDILLVGGSIPEIDESGNIYNTSFVFDGSGKQIARHRKAHLFNINIPGGLCFSESQHLQAGNEITIAEYQGIRFSVQICFDIRFPELSRQAALAGASLLMVPAAFNTTTGPLHWELAMRSRAVDNQIFVAACSPARDPHASYQAWGHSLAVDPMGRIIAMAGAGEEIVLAELDLGQIEETRRALPIIDSLRPGLYDQGMGKS